MFRDDSPRAIGRKLWPDALRSDSVSESFAAQPSSAPTTPRRGLLPQEVTHVIFDDFGATPRPQESPVSPKTARANTGSVRNPITGEPNPQSASPKRHGVQLTEHTSRNWTSQVNLPGGVPDDQVPKAKPRGVRRTEVSDKHFAGDQQPVYENPHHYHLTKKAPGSPKSGPTTPTNGSPRATYSPRSGPMFELLTDAESNPRPGSAGSPRRAKFPQEVTHIVFDDFNRTASPPPRPGSAGSRGRANLSTVNPLSGATVDPKANQERPQGRGRTSHSNDAFSSTVPF